MTNRVVAHSLTIESELSGDVFTVRLLGELDTASAPALRDYLQRALRSEADLVVVDMDELEFIDSSGLQALLVATQRARGDRDQLRILTPRGQVARVISLTNLNGSLPLVPRQDL